MRRNEYPLRAEWPEPEHESPLEFVKAAAVFGLLLAAIFGWAIVLGVAR